MRTDMTNLIIVNNNVRVINHTIHFPLAPIPSPVNVLPFSDANLL